eukprot:c12373_g1_i1.p1 GENE.c12373_g1_i1~~c12373_g1_i1.p1  ORF type:complete len:451 (+),score=66.46 c12373_g1_i1:109-1461(+)
MSSSSEMTHGLQSKNNNLKWSKEEDQRLMQLVLEMGTKWVRIAKKFNHRSDVALKNRYLTFVRQGKVPKPISWRFEDAYARKDLLALQPPKQPRATPPSSESKSVARHVACPSPSNTTLPQPARRSRGRPKRDSLPTHHLDLTCDDTSHFRTKTNKVYSNLNHCDEPESWSSRKPKRIRSCEEPKFEHNDNPNDKIFDDDDQDVDGESSSQTKSEKLTNCNLQVVTELRPKKVAERQNSTVTAMRLGTKGETSFGVVSSAASPNHDSQFNLNKAWQLGCTHRKEEYLPKLLPIPREPLPPLPPLFPSLPSLLPMSLLNSSSSQFLSDKPILNPITLRNTLLAPPSQNLPPIQEPHTESVLSFHRHTSSHVSAEFHTAVSQSSSADAQRIREYLNPHTHNHFEFPRRASCLDAPVAPVRTCQPPTTQMHPSYEALQCLTTLAEPQGPHWQP